MARTKASVGAKVSSGKSSKARCSVAPPSSSAGPSGSDKSSKNYSGGNPVCPRETPKWQKPITNFFINNTKADEDEAQASSSKPKSKKNVIHSDDENEIETEIDKPKNQELDESIELEPLKGEECHKIQEYYTTKDKKKGKGKKSNKENIEVRRNSVKRDLETVIFGEESEHVSKKAKVA
ncbi:unnamed protein product, partial [Brenthis ino]